MLMASSPCGPAPAAASGSLREFWSRTAARSSSSSPPGETFMANARACTSPNARAILCVLPCRAARAMSKGGESVAREQAYVLGAIFGNGKSALRFELAAHTGRVSWRH